MRFFLKSSDDVVTEVSRDVVESSVVLSNCTMDMDDSEQDVTIPIVDVRNEILSLVIKGKDIDFAPLDDNVVLEIALVANMLYMKDLMTRTCAELGKRLSSHMDDVQYLRNFFHIENDFTPEEEERIRKESVWDFGM